MNFLKRGLLISLSTAMLAVLLLLLRASPASATCTTVGGCQQTAPPNCLQDEFNFEGGTQNLNCNANDVKIAFAKNARDAKGNPIPQCVLGSTFSFIADFTVVTTATARENIGLYMATAGQVSALTGTCTDNIISPLHDPGAFGVTNCSNTVGTTQCLGTSSYEELDPQTDTKGNATPDNCGDISTAENNQVITVAVSGVKCEPSPGCDPATQKCNLVLPNCTSWQQPGGTIQCESDPPTTGWPYVTAAVPGSPSKCSCNNTFTVPIQVITPGLGVTKKANPTSISGTDGGTSTYTVTVTNTNSPTGSDTVNRICDTVYGTIATSAGQPACSAATTATNISCTSAGSSITFPFTLANPGDSLTCTFSGAVPENSTVTDTVTADAVSSSGASVSGSDSATVTAGDAPAAAKFIKTLGSSSPTSGCATVVYNVEVDNTSGLTTDEDETLTTLSDDKYGDITTVHGNAATNLSVVSTTCAVGAKLSASPAGKYTCSFDGVMCGTLGPLTSPPSPTSCAAGIELTDTLNGTLTGDETGESVTTTPGSRTVDVCFVASSN